MKRPFRGFLCGLPGFGKKTGGKIGFSKNRYSKKTSNTAKYELGN